MLRGLLVVWVVGCGLWVVGCGLWVVGCGLWAVGCGLWAVGLSVSLTTSLGAYQHPSSQLPIKLIHRGVDALPDPSFGGFGRATDLAIDYLAF